MLLVWVTSKDAQSGSHSDPLLPPCIFLLCVALNQGLTALGFWGGRPLRKQPAVKSVIQVWRLRPPFFHPQIPYSYTYNGSYKRKSIGQFPPPHDSNPLIPP